MQTTLCGVKGRVRGSGSFYNIIVWNISHVVENNLISEQLFQSWTIII